MPRRPAARLRLVPLEDRTAPATFTVSTTADSGAGSLRQAIASANANPGADSIRFAVGSGAISIAPASALPAITGPLSLDGSTQPGFAGVPIVELNGTNAGSEANGLTLSGHIGSTIRGLVIDRFQSSGIRIEADSGGHTIAGNYIGLAADGAMRAVNGGSGIDAAGSTGGTLIGGTMSTDRNVISGNYGSGINVVLDTAGTFVGPVIRGNYIGTNAAGTAAVANLRSGVFVNARYGTMTGVTIGGTTTGAGNTVSGNSQAGIYLADNAQGTGEVLGATVQGNRIGTDATGVVAVPNGSVGLLLSGTRNASVGGTAAGAGNLISGNASYELGAADAIAAVVQGNQIGVNAAGSADLSTGSAVILAQFSRPETILLGGTSAAAGNRITAPVGNTAVGVGGSTTATILGNRITGGSGITLSGGANGNEPAPTLNPASAIPGGVRLTGTLTSAANDTYRVELFSTQSRATVLGAATVTTDATGQGSFTFDAPTAPAGTYYYATSTRLSTGATSPFSALQQLPGTLMVTTTADSGAGSLRQAILDANAASGPNIIGFAIGFGAVTIRPTSALPAITDAVTLDATGQPGYAGTPLVELDGTNAGTGANGLTLTGHTGSTVRGLVVNRFNGAGIQIGANAGGDTIAGNYVGTTADGTAAAGNAGGGVVSLASALGGSTIGGTTAADRNVISGNGTTSTRTPGVQAVNGDLVLGDFVGTNAAGTAAVPNYVGVLATARSTASAAPVTIGGTAAGAGNVVSGNTLFGIQTASVRGFTATIQGNYVGLNAAGTGAVANGASGYAGDGIRIGNPDGATVGGTTAAARNVASGNLGSGIGVLDLSYPAFATFTGPVIQGNYVGTNAAGVAAVPNGSSLYGGILVITGTLMTGLRIGGDVVGAGNLIAGNAYTGIDLSGLGGTGGNQFSDARVQGNRIGVNAAGTARLSNTSDAISVFDTSGILVGGSTAGAGNLIVTAGADPVFVADSTDVTVRGNAIGTAALPTLGYGVSVSASNRATAATLDGNRVVSQRAGLYLIGGTGLTLTTTLTANLFSPFPGQTATIGPTAGNNEGLAAPTITSAVRTVSAARVSGTFAGKPNNSYRVEVFSDENGGTFLGFVTATTTSTGTGTFAFDTAGVPPTGTRYSATVTRTASGASSPYATAKTITGGVLTGTAFTDADDSGSRDTSEGPAAAVTVFDDANNNGGPDTGEATAVTATDGSYSLVFTADGSHRVRVVTAGTVIRSTANPADVTVSGGATVAGGDFGLFDTAASVSVAAAEVAEGDSGTVDLVFTLTRTGNTITPITVDVATRDGTAAAGSDYTAFAGPVTFAQNAATATVRVPVLGNTRLQSDRAFNLDVTGRTGVTVTTPSAFGTIRDDDAVMSLTATAGTPQTAEAGTAFSVAPAAVAKNARGAAVQGATVTFTLTPGAGGATGTLGGPASVTTGADGTASVPVTAGTTAGQFTLTAATGGQSAAFVLRNETRPMITGVADQTFLRDRSAGPLAFTVADATTAAGSLTLSASSTDTTLVPVSGVTFGGTGGSRTVTVTPAAGRTGSATVTVIVTDGYGLTASTSFLVTVVTPAVTLSNAAVPEFRPPGTVVGAFDVPLANGATHTYSLAAGSGADDNAAFFISGAALLTAAPLDLATKPAYSVRVRATDDGGRTFDQVLTITPTDDPAFTRTGRTLAVTGTAGDDVIAFTAGTPRHTIYLNGYRMVDAATVDTITFAGGGGKDLVYLIDPAAGATATLGAGTASLRGAGYAMTATGVTTAVAYGGAGGTAAFAGSAGNDLVSLNPTYGVMAPAGGFTDSAVGFGGYSATGNGGQDVAYLTGSAGNDTYTADAGSAVLSGPGFRSTATGFTAVTAFGGGGTDTATLTGTAGNDAVGAGAGYAQLYQSNGGYLGASGFGGIAVKGNGGSDAAYLVDSPGNDTLTASGAGATLSGPGYSVAVDLFAGVTAYGFNGGTNRKAVTGVVRFYLAFPGDWM